MEQYDEALGATDAALNSAGSGYRENAEYLKSFEAQINMVKNSWTETIIAMRDGGLGDTMVLGLKTGLELLKVLTSIIDTFGTFPTVVGLGTVAISTFSSKTRGALVGIGEQLVGLATSFSRVSTTSTAAQSSVAKTAQSMNVMSTSALRAKSSVDMLSASQAASSRSAGALNGSVLTASGSVQRFGAASSAGATGAKALGTSLTATGVAARGFVGSLMMASLPIAIFSGLAWGIGKVVGKISEQVQEQKELERSIEETMNTNVEAVTTNMEQVEALRSSYRSLSEEKERVGDTDSWSTEKEQEYLQVQQDLADIFPALVKEIDSKGQAHLMNADAIEEEIARTKELANIEGGKALYEEEKTYGESLKNLAMYQDKVMVAEHQMTRYQEKADKARTDSARKTHLGKVANYRAELAHYETIVRGIESSAKQEMKTLSGIFMQVSDVSGRVVEESQRIFDSIDISSKSKDDLAEIRRELDLFAQDRQNAFDTGDMEEFNKKTTELKNYLTNELKMPKEDISEYITYFNALTIEIEEAEEKAKRTAQAMSSLNLELEDGTEDADEYSEMLGAVAEEMDKLTDRISNINSVLETYNENGELSNQQILDLLEKYPDLIQYIGDEARLIEELTIIRDEDVKKAEQQLINKLMLNREFYNNNLDLIQEFISEQFKFYEGDLKDWQNLAQAKADVETELINKLSRQWGAYYNEVTKQFGISAERQVLDIMSGPLVSPELSKMRSDEMMRIAAANASLRASADAWDSFSLDRVSVDFKALGTSADKATGSVGKSSKAKKSGTKATNDLQKAAEKYNKEIERSIYLADTYKMAMEKLNLEMAKVQEAKDREAKGSIEYQRQMEKELALLMKEKELLQDRSTELAKQISLGNVVKTGVVKTTTTTSGQNYTGKYASEINKASQTYGIDPNIIAAVIRAESNFNPNARSHAGAQGLMQLMPGTARHLGVANPYNAEQNIMGGTKYLAEQLKAFSGDIKMALAAYNAGPGNVRKYGGIPPFKETQNYVKKVTNEIAKTTTATTENIGNSIADYYLGNTFRLSSGFGKRNTGIKGASTNHLGIDLAAKSGTDIKSLRSGKVVASYYHNNQGHVIRIQQDDGVVAQYQHMQGASPLKVGQAVGAGQSIGKVGMSGTASGPHLHLEITQNGKKVDPAKYLDEQGKAIATSTQEVAQHAQDIDGMRSDLNQTSMDILAINQKIRDAQMAIIDSVGERHQLLKQNYEGLIQNSENRLKKMTESSAAYRNELDKQRTSIEAKLKYAQSEYDYYDKMIKSGTLNASVAQELQQRLHELGLEMNNLKFSLRDLDFRKVSSEMKAFSDEIDDYLYDIQRSQAIMNLLEKGSEDYRIEAEFQLEVLKKQRDAILRQRDALQKLMLTQNLTVEQMEELRKKVQELSLEYYGILGSINDTNSLIEDSNEEAVSNIADNLINAYKRYIEEKRDMHMESLEEEMRAEDKRHRKQMDNYRDELDQFRKIIQERLDSIDKEESQRSYDKEIDALEKERSEIDKRIKLLSMDDSYEAKAERKKLQEQLADVDETIAEKRHQREVELRKDNLNEMMKDKEEQIEKEEELETERHESEKDRIDKEKEYWNQFYIDMLNDERKFAQMKKDIVAGNFEALSEEFQEYISEMKETMPDLENTLDGTMKAVGTSIRQNIIEELERAIELMNEFQEGQTSGSGGIGDYGKELSEADMKVMAGKYLMDVVANKEQNKEKATEIREKASQLGSEGRSEGSTVKKDMGYDAIYSSLTEPQRKQLMKYLSDNALDISGDLGIESDVGDYDSGGTLSNADLKVIMGKLMTDKMARPDVESIDHRRQEILQRGQNLGSEGRSEGSKIPRSQSYDDIIGELDTYDLENVGTYMKTHGTNMFITDYLQDYVRQEYRKIMSSAARAESGGYTGNFSGEKLAYLHEKELILNKGQTEQFFKHIPVLERLSDMMNSVRSNASKVGLPQGISGDTDNSIHVDIHIKEMLGNKKDIDLLANQMMESIRVRKGRK